MCEVNIQKWFNSPRTPSDALGHFGRMFAKYVKAETQHRAIAPPQSSHHSQRYGPPAEVGPTLF
jgi:hypothetical protein